MSALLMSQDWHSRLRSLPENWDSYGAIPITDAALSTVGQFAVVPLCSGGVQLEIHQNGYDIEIEIGPDGSIQTTLIGLEKS